MEFTPIETQEQFDNAIQGRLKRMTEKHQAEIDELNSSYADLKDKADKYDEMESSYKQQIADLNAQHEASVAELNAKISGYDSQISEKDSKIASYEVEKMKTNIVLEMGLNPGSTKFISGTTEEEIRASAKELSLLIPNQPAPLAQNPENAVDGVTAAFMKLNPNIKL